jgi:hypothetical protein
MDERSNTPQDNEVSRHAFAIPNSDRSPLYDVRNPARASCEGRNVRSDVFADDKLGNRLSDQLSARLRLRRLRRARFAQEAKRGCATRSPLGRSVVEPDGIEPTTSCLQSTRSPS